MRHLKFKTHLELASGDEIRVSVIGDYYPRFAGSYEEPAHEHFVEDLVIEHEGKDITAEVSKDDLQRLKEFFLLEAMEVTSWKR